MSLLASLKTDDSIIGEKDSVGGSGGPLESGMYNAKVSMAYLTKSSGGALGLVLTLKTVANREIRQTLWMTSGSAKGCKNYYENKDGEKQFLPGFNLANSLCLLTVGKEVSEMDTETKMVNVYNPEAKAEVPTKVDVVMDLINQEIIVGLFKQVVDKTKKNETTGVYEPTGETREENEIDKFFRASDRMTTAEIKAAANEAVFANTWESKHTGKTREKAKGASANAGVVSGAPKAASKPANKPTTSLFG
jgi:hypothetical protein